MVMDFFSGKNIHLELSLLHSDYFVVSNCESFCSLRYIFFTIHLSILYI
jgi:hypothetical protein